MMESLVRQYRATAAQQPYAAERLLTTFMKVQAALARSLKQRDDDQLRREEFRKTVPQIVERCTSEAMRSILPLMSQNMTNLREEVRKWDAGSGGVLAASGAVRGGMAERGWSEDAGGADPGAEG